jgi:spore germination protein GerM
VGQVLYTATSIDPNAKVWLSVGGKPLDTLGGEGLLLEQPMTRDRFKQDFPQQQ